MTMVVSKKRRIFFQLEGERGAFVLLLHGLLGSHEDWYRAGYVEELAPEFRLIIPDLRGHGRSDRTTDPQDYALPAFAEDMVEILNALNVRNTHVLGYSLGALVGFDLLMRFRDRVRASALGGETPFVTEGARGHWRALAEGLAAEPSPAPEGAAPEAPLPTGLAAADDPLHQQEAQRVMLEAMAAWPLPTAERYGVYAPVTLFCGAHDPAAERIELAGRRIARARFLSLSDADHQELFDQRERLLGQIKPLFKAGGRGAEGAPGRAPREGGRPPRPERPEGSEPAPPRPTRPVLDIRELERERAARGGPGAPLPAAPPPPAAPAPDEPLSPDPGAELEPEERPAWEQAEPEERLTGEPPDQEAPGTEPAEAAPSPAEREREARQELTETAAEEPAERPAWDQPDAETVRDDDAEAEDATTREDGRAEEEDSAEEEPGDRPAWDRPDAESARDDDAEEGEAEDDAAREDDAG